MTEKIAACQHLFIYESLDSIHSTVNDLYLSSIITVSKLLMNTYTWQTCTKLHVIRKQGNTYIFHYNLQLPWAAILLTFFLFSWNKSSRKEQNLLTFFFNFHFTIFSLSLASYFLSFPPHVITDIKLEEQIFLSL